MAVVRVMWPLGILLVTLCALTASAMADPSEPARPALEVEGASALAKEGTDLIDAAGPSRVPRGLDPGSRSRAGNPLWTVPVIGRCFQSRAVLLSSTPQSPPRRQSRRPLRLLPLSGRCLR
jgi:hypothetical protein